MELVKAGLKLDFTEAMSPWLDLRGLFRAAQDDPGAEVQGQPLVTVNTDRRQRVVLQVKSFSVEQEGTAAHPASPDAALSVVERIAAATPLEEVRSRRFDMMFIDPFELPFQELVSEMKSSIFVQGGLIDRATDIAVSLDERIGESDTNHMQIGPMSPPQLNAQFLAISRDDLPEQFLFIGIGRSWTTPVSFSLDSLIGDFHAFAEWAPARAADLAGIVRR